MAVRHCVGNHIAARRGHRRIPSCQGSARRDHGPIPSCQSGGGRIRIEAFQAAGRPLAIFVEHDYTLQVSIGKGDAYDSTRAEKHQGGNGVDSHGRWVVRIGNLI